MGKAMISKEPVRGMRDVLPEEMRLRNEVLDTMRRVYGSYGFEQIETPCMERIENLSNNQGGDNEKLVFKVMKRGDKLARAFESGQLGALADSGMRYDLTLPLSRYYASNIQKLPQPFKAMQIGPVWRADRPQLGRYRQFCQADIDILGDDSLNAEIELISATSSLLKKIGIPCRVRVSDRRLLASVAAYCGFAESEFSEVFVVMDKLDKIGLEGVCVELLTTGYAGECVDAYRELMEGFREAPSGLSYCSNLPLDDVGKAAIKRLSSIIEGVAHVTFDDVVPKLDLSLVRGMGYYTGTIFEVESSEFNSSIAGGGRYDKMIGSFTGKDVPACGFSIGFERIIQILLDKEHLRTQENKIAVLYDRKVTTEEVINLQRECQQLREEGAIVLLVKKANNVNHQKERLFANGYEKIIVATCGFLCEQEEGARV